MKTLNQLATEVKAVKASLNAAAKSLANSKAPRELVNAKKTQAKNVVSIFESYVCFFNMQQAGYGCSDNVAEWESKLAEALTWK